MKVKDKVVCPHCGQIHTVTIDVPARRRNRINYRPVYNGSRMEYAIAEVDEGFDLALDWKRINDIAFYPIGFGLGGLGGSIVYLLADAWWGPLYNPDLLLSLSLTGGAIVLYWTHWVLCDMSKQDRKKRSLLKYWQDHSVPASKEQSGPVVLEVSHRERDGASEQGRTIQYFGQLPVDPQDFVEYIKAITAGRSLAINQWVGSDKPFERASYEALLAILRDSGAVINLGGNKGHQVTTQGRRAFRNYLRQVSN